VLAGRSEQQVDLPRLCLGTTRPRGGATARDQPRPRSRRWASRAAIHAARRAKTPRRPPRGRAPPHRVALVCACLSALKRPFRSVTGSRAFEIDGLNGTGRFENRPSPSRHGSTRAVTRTQSKSSAQAGHVGDSARQVDVGDGRALKLLAIFAAASLTGVFPQIDRAHEVPSSPASDQLAFQIHAGRTCRLLRCGGSPK